MGARGRSRAGETTGRPVRRRWRWLYAAVVLLLVPLLSSLAVRMAGPASAASWWEARRDSSGQAPDPAVTNEAVLQIYAARTYGWRGAFGVHTWFAVKPTGAASYTRLEVIGWYAYGGGRALRASNGIPDAYWFGSRPELLLDLRGDGVDALIDEVEAAAERYPYANHYRVWPGPNSNTFTAFVAREVPSLRLELPPLAVGKDFLPNGELLADSPSSTGKQVSLFGLAGIMVGAEEGLEVNLLGLTFGFDVAPLALKLPGLGRIGGS